MPEPHDRTDDRDWSASLPHWVALGAAIFTWPLLLVGGLVTVYRVGMAVPDWPTTFGMNMFLFNMFESAWGVFVEHGHRLYGSLVGAACIGLVVYFTLARSGTRGTGWLAAVLATSLGAVACVMMKQPEFLAWLIATGLISMAAGLWFLCLWRDLLLCLVWQALALAVVQGTLGGFRVTLNSAVLAYAHGVTAQLFLALLVTIWVITDPRWPTQKAISPDESRLRMRATATWVLIVVQIMAGGYVRHFSSAMAAGIHAALALAVLVHVGMIVPRIERSRVELNGRGLISASRWMAVWTLVQVVLGVLALVMVWPLDGVARPISRMQALVRVSHQGAGALLLASSTVLTLRSWHVLKSPTKEPSRLADAGIFQTARAAVPEVAI